MGQEWMPTVIGSSQSQVVSSILALLILVYYFCSSKGLHVSHHGVPIAAGLGLHWSVNGRVPIASMDMFFVLVAGLHTLPARRRLQCYLYHASPGNVLNNLLGPEPDFLFDVIPLVFLLATFLPFFYLVLRSQISGAFLFAIHRLHS